LKPERRKYYAGIGSCETPEDVLISMTNIGRVLEEMQYILRSGAAIGADSAFEKLVPKDRKEIFVAADADAASMAIAARFHPNWSACNDYARKLHARNAKIVLGSNLKSPVSFVVCWTPGGELSGGIAMGIRIARHYAIPVYNLANRDHHFEFWKRLNQERSFKNSFLSRYVCPQ
jgi:hypothetical protein